MENTAKGKVAITFCTDTNSQQDGERSDGVSVRNNTLVNVGTVNLISFGLTDEAYNRPRQK